METSTDRKIAQLRDAGVSPELCAKIAALLTSESPVPLAKAVPPRLAEQWQLPAAEVLEAFLSATRLGMFDLEWNMRCPSCTGPVQQHASLDQIHSDGECPYCDINFTGSFDESIEVTWRVHPSLRDISEAPFQEVLTQHFQPAPVLMLGAEPQATARGEASLEPGNYQLVVPALMAATGLRVHQASAGERRLEVGWDGQRIDRGAWDQPAGRYEIILRNDSAAPVEWMMTRVTEAPWVSAAQLACCQSFRDMFTSELIRPDDDFAIRSLTFVFTDLKGSTALYERVGDSRAFALVRDHFEIMIQLVHEHRGAIVKTIGDAIMATFLEREAALSFALAVHRALDGFNEEHETPDAIIVKVGIHSGPCIAVNLNDRVDYFGRTVNTAARIQGLSKGGDVVVSQAYGNDPELRNIWIAAGWRERPFTASLKGIAGAAELLELTRRPA